MKLNYTRHRNIRQTAFILLLSFAGLGRLQAQTAIQKDVVFTPTVISGGNKTIQLPTNSTAISVTVKDSSGRPAMILWTRQSGPGTPVITSPYSLNTTVTGLSAGTYVFRCMVRNDHGLSGHADVQVVVNPATTGLVDSGRIPEPYERD